MAIYHLSAKVISRGKSQSAIAAAAYRSGERLHDEQAGQQKYYTSRAERIQFTDIMAPKDAPEWAHDRNALWNHAERAEKRKDAQLAREFEISLPHELTAQQREWLVKDFAREAFVRKGYAVDIAIHAPDPESDQRNHHAHLMVTMRELGPDGFARLKDRSLNSDAQLGEWRGQWAHLANRHLERHGHAERIDHRSLKEQGVDREATIHLGYAASAMADRGAQSDRMDELREILARNEIRLDLKSLQQELAALEKAELDAQRKEALRSPPVPEQGGAQPHMFQHQKQTAAQRQRALLAHQAADQATAQRRVLEQQQRDAALQQEAVRQRQAAEQAAAQRRVAEQQKREAGAQRIAGERAKAEKDAGDRRRQEELREREAARRAEEVRKQEAARERVAAEKIQAARVAAEKAGTAAPAKPIEHINAGHAAAEAERQRIAAARVKNDEAFKDSFQQTDYSLPGLSTNAPKPLPSYLDKRGIRDTTAAPDLSSPGNVVVQADKGLSKLAKGAVNLDKGLRVFDRVTGVTTKLTDFIVDFLAGTPAAEPGVDTEKFTIDPAVRKKQQLARLAAQEEREADRKALERIEDDIKKGVALKPEDIRKLTRQHQESIRQFGDSAVVQMVDEARKERSWTKGEGRERE